jgi:hypothetical protein
LGYIEGDGSFFLSRTDLEPVFSITASEEQQYLFEHIKAFLGNSLGFDKYSLFKLKIAKGISINKSKAREIGKPGVVLFIRSIKILNNYLIPYFEDMSFISKKGLDFKDFKLITLAVYKGSQGGRAEHGRQEEVRSLILKLSNTMNNFRLSTFQGEESKMYQAIVVSQEERDLILNASSTLEYLEDGRI